MVAASVAVPVLEAVASARRHGVVLGASGAAAHIEVDGFVIAVTPRGGPLLPNGIVVTGRHGSWPGPGSPVRVRPGRLDAGAEWVTWQATGTPSAIWDPALPVAEAGAAPAVRARAAAILEALGLPGGAAPEALAAALGDGHAGCAGDGAELLLRAVADRDPALAARAAAALTGLGPGLTPRGDDLLAGAASAVWAFGHAAGWPAAERAAWLAALLRADRRERTTAVSVTLLELAATGRALEPAHGLLALGGPAEAAWPGALRRLCTTGHSTGRAYAAAIGATGLLLAG